MTLPETDLANQPEPAPRQRFFNLPGVVVWTLAVLGGVHLLRMAISDDADDWVIRTFAFIPYRLTGSEPDAFPGGTLGSAWTFLTYALLHADLGHILVNGFYLAAFGSPLARRLGTLRFLAFTAAGAVGGALLHLATHVGGLAPVVGASAAISAHLAGTCRFGFAPGGPLTREGQQSGEAAYRLPAMPLLVTLAQRPVQIFLLTWFGVNLVFGLVGGGGAIVSGGIAWEAHIGGFLVGLLAFPLFDRILPPLPPSVDPTDDLEGPAVESN